VTNVVILVKQLVRRKALDILSLIIVNIPIKSFESRPVVFSTIDCIFSFFFL
jgi:hypothetical protein